LQFCQESLYKVKAKEGMGSEKIISIKKKSATMHLDDKKDALRTFQELARPHISVGSSV
jgi:hypothetical protein